MPPLGLYIFAPLFVNIDQIPLIRGMFRGQDEIKSPPFASRGVGALQPLFISILLSLWGSS